MKTFIITFIGFFILGITQLHAQNFLDKLDRTLNKIDKAANTADRAAGTGSKVMGLMGKKKNANGANAEAHTVIAIEGIDMASLKSLNQSIQNAQGVAATKMKYGAAGSSIVVDHKGTTDQLLQIIQPLSNGILADKNITGLEDGTISVKVKK